MDFTALMLLRELGSDDPVHMACHYWSQSFAITLRTEAIGWRFSSILRWYYNEVEIMARKGKTNEPVSPRSGFEPVRWFNVSLAQQDVDTITDWVASDPDLLSELLRLAAGGYAVSIRPTTDNDSVTYICSITGRGDDDSLCGVSGFAASPYDALAAAIYKFVSLLEGAFRGASPGRSSRYR